MGMPDHATQPPTPAPKGGGRLKSALPVLAVVAGFATYWHVLPDGILNAAVGATPLIGTSACLAFTASPLCYVFGWSSDDSAPPFNAEYRIARIRMLAAKHNVTGEISLSGGPHLTEAQDRSGYLNWLGHASETEFEQVLADLDVRLGLQALATDFQNGGGE